jgi:hypothetical protein
MLFGTKIATKCNAPKTTPHPLISFMPGVLPDGCTKNLCIPQAKLARQTNSSSANVVCQAVTAIV